jgi:hypothetical protein
MWTQKRAKADRNSSKMDTFAETATFDHRLSFANQEKQTSVFGLQHADGSCRLLLVLFSFCGIPQTRRHGHGDMETWKWRHGNIEA